MRRLAYVLPLIAVASLYAADPALPSLVFDPLFTGREMADLVHGETLLSHRPAHYGQPLPNVRCRRRNMSPDKRGPGRDLVGSCHDPSLTDGWLRWLINRRRNPNCP